MLPRAHIGMVFVLACGIALVACSAGDSSPPCHNTGTPVEGVDGGIACGVPYTLDTPEGTTGRFAVKVVQYLHMSSAGLVETDTIGAAIGWAEFVHEPGATSGRMDLKLCHLEVPKINIPGQPAASSLELMPGALDHVPPPGAAFVVSDYETCGTVHTEPNVVLVAARLVDSLRDPLPCDVTTQTCSTTLAQDCLFDQDEDGKPAVTFLARNFPALPVDEIYATLRSWVALDGIAATPDLLLGQATFGLEIAVVGCRIEPLGGGALRACSPDETDVIAQITPTITQNPDMESHFVAVRVDPGFTCDDVISQADHLFGR